MRKFTSTQAVCYSPPYTPNAIQLCVFSRDEHRPITMCASQSSVAEPATADGKGKGKRRFV